MIAKFENNCLTIAAGEFAAAITVREISGAWNALSHFPDRRAAVELAGLAENLNSFAEYAYGLAARSDRLDAASEIERFARRHVQLSRRAWAMESRCASWFIVGPSNFPSASNAKRQASSDRAYQHRREHFEAAKRAVERLAFPFGAPNGPIRANNPEAPEMIRAKIAKCTAVQNAMKAANDAIRRAKTKDPAALVEVIRGVTGWSDGVCAKVAQPDYAGRIGFPAYMLANNRAEIKRLEARLQSMEQCRAAGDSETVHATEHGSVRVVANATGARLQMIFEGKPAEAVRADLKANGFRWAPSEGAWQRHLNANGWYAARRVLEAIGAEDFPPICGWSSETAAMRVGGTMGT